MSIFLIPYPPSYLVFWYGNVVPPSSWPYVHTYNNLCPCFPIFRPPLVQSESSTIPWWPLLVFLWYITNTHTVFQSVGSKFLKVQVMPAAPVVATKLHAAISLDISATGQSVGVFVCKDSLVHWPQGHDVMTNTWRTANLVHNGLTELLVPIAFLISEDYQNILPK